MHPLFGESEEDISGLECGPLQRHNEAVQAADDFLKLLSQKIISYKRDYIKDWVVHSTQSCRLEGKTLLCRDCREYISENPDPDQYKQDGHEHEFEVTSNDLVLNRRLQWEKNTTHEDLDKLDRLLEKFEQQKKYILTDPELVDLARGELGTAVELSRATEEVERLRQENQELRQEISALEGKGEHASALSRSRSTPSFF